MHLPPLLNLSSQSDYRDHFTDVYCRGPIETFDGIQVRFRRSQFYHCCFESVASKDDTFSWQRAERLDWIKAVLQSSEAELRVGWDNAKKRQATNRRVALVVDSYVVVIQLRNATNANFITAFVANDRAVEKIRTNPLWE